MPKRSRSHQVEDISINRFEALLPPAWAARRKEKDYGTDLEVEIFEDDGRDTGLIFLVQLRATDDPKKGKKLPLEFEQIAYFGSLRLPTVVVRYDHINEAFHWQWHFNIVPAGRFKPGQKTFTKHFADGECWVADSPAAIRQTLHTIRLLASYRSTATVSIGYDGNSLSPKDQYIVEAAIHDVVEMASGILVERDASPQHVRIDITASEAGLKCGIDCLLSFELELKSYEKDVVTDALLYGVVAALHRAALTHQADNLARAIALRGRPHPSKFMAMEACRALSSDVGLSARLAVINGLHEPDEYYPLFAAHLLAASGGAERNAAVAAFYDAALVSARCLAPETEGAVHYSIGNFYRVQGDHLRAVAHFNQARKLRPAYCRTAYFLSEYGACFFGSSRYRNAVRLYQLALELEPGPRLQLHLGDALLFSGAVAGAAECYQLAATTGDSLLSAEAALKLVLCDVFIERGNVRVPTRRTEASALLDMEDLTESEQFALWNRIVDEIDAMNEIAHFNLGVHHARRGDNDRAGAHFLLCAVKQSGDLEAWTNVILCAFNAQRAELVVAAMSCAVALEGRRPYAKLRELLLLQGAHEQMVEGLDTVFRELDKTRKSQNDDGTTMRILGDDGHITIKMDR